jgi:hypothetical protein
MNRLPKSDDDLEPRIAATLLEVLIRAGLILILAIICYQVFAPFMNLVVGRSSWPSHSIRCTKGSPGGWEAGRESLGDWSDARA